ncbi:uncharacterized protein VTP21DRAFT_7144 [Calcarisporiella thermophila]|uniref:uncharacterized protein n=1 Tax=Calcarisporiella thermophila TaxID=911321 RepID=UPI0037449BDC
MIVFRPLRQKLDSLTRSDAVNESSSDVDLTFARRLSSVSPLSPLYATSPPSRDDMGTKQAAGLAKSYDPQCTTRIARRRSDTLSCLKAGVLRIRPAISRRTSQPFVSNLLTKKELCETSLCRSPTSTFSIASSPSTASIASVDSSIDWPSSSSTTSCSSYSSIGHTSSWLSHPTGKLFNKPEFDMSPYTDGNWPVSLSGSLMLKVSAKRMRYRLLRLDPEQGRIMWDSKKDGIINIENIKDLRIGPDARIYREQFKISSDQEERWMSIFYHQNGRQKTFHCIAPTRKIFNDFVTVLRRLMSDQNQIGLLRWRNSCWLVQRWREEIAGDKEDRVNFEQIAQFCRQLNIQYSRRELKIRFDSVDEHNQGTLGFDEFTKFIRALKDRREVNAIFHRWAKQHADKITLSEFKQFMMEAQKMSDTDERFSSLYHKYADGTGLMSMDCFTSFLLSFTDNGLISPNRGSLYEDMTLPLNMYFIASSHNTYLLGHQLTGQSSVEGYVRALREGCRCVELDCWDGPDGPIIYHGHTLTTKIHFKDALEAIAQHAFVASPYPLILSLEVHCCLEQQETMAALLHQVFGDCLVTRPLRENEACLPSPAELMYRVLIKGKIHLPHHSTNTPETESEGDSREGDWCTESEPDDPPSMLLGSPPTMKEVQGSTKKPKVAKALSDLAVYCKAVKYRTFDVAHRFQVLSFSERVASRIYRQCKRSFVEYNRNCMTRVYPAGTRIASSNFEPQKYWAAGSQFVALNYQTFDRGMQINRAMFLGNGKSGYILKPASIRASHLPTPPASPIYSSNYTPELCFVSWECLWVEVEIISAHHLHRRDSSTSPVVGVRSDALGMDPYCEVELLGPEGYSVRRRTAPVPENGFNPVWQEGMKFRIIRDKVEHAELLFLRFEVCDEQTGDIVGIYCARLVDIQQGYRNVPLYDVNGEMCVLSSLLVRIDIAVDKNIE